MRQLLAPSEYTIDADYMNGQSNLVEVAPNIAKSIAHTCQEYGFAIVRNTFGAEEFDRLQQDCAETFQEEVIQRRTKQCSSSEASGVVKTREHKTQLTQPMAGLVGNFVLRLQTAAQGYPRMETKESTVDALFLAQFGPKGRVYRHTDSVSGVMCETSIDGRALMGFWRGWRKVADVVLNPNDTVVLPARTPGSQPRDLIKHDVVNVTRQKDSSAQSLTRLSLIYNYGRTRPANVAKAKQTVAQ